jgi:hypothetical protein
MSYSTTSWRVRQQQEVTNARVTGFVFGACLSAPWWILGTLWLAGHF